MLSSPDLRWLRNLILAGTTVIVNYGTGMGQALLGFVLADITTLTDDQSKVIVTPTPGSPEPLSFRTLATATAIGCAILLPIYAIGIYILDMWKSDSDLIADFNNDHTNPVEHDRLVRKKQLGESKFRSVVLRLTAQGIIPLCTIVGMLIVSTWDSSIGADQIRTALAGNEVGFLVFFIVGGGGTLIGRELYHLRERRRLQIAEPPIHGSHAFQPFHSVAASDALTYAYEVRVSDHSPLPARHPLAMSGHSARSHQMQGVMDVAPSARPHNLYHATTGILIPPITACPNREEVFDDHPTLGR